MGCLQCNGVEGLEHFSGRLFKPFSRGESIVCRLEIELKDPSTGLLIDMSGYQVFISFSLIEASESAPPIEQQLDYVVGSTNIFFGVVTDEKTLSTFPVGTEHAYGAVKYVDPDGNTHYQDKAKIPIGKNSNSRLDLEP